MSRWISSKHPKSNGNKLRNAAEIPNLRHHGTDVLSAQPWPPLRCPSLEALVAEVVAAQVDFCNGPVDTKGVGEGLQNWHEAHGQVDSRLVGVPLQLCCYALSTGSSACLAQTSQGTCQDCGYEPDMTPVRSSCHHPAHSIEHTSSLSQCVPHCNTFFNVKTFRNFVSYPEKG